jgi:hypothetical protein
MYPEDGQMNLLDHNAHGATIHLDERELLLMMALIQEGRISFECESKTGQALDELVSKAVVLVDQARKNALRQYSSH